MNFSQFFQTSSFKPDLVSTLFNPFHIARKSLYISIDISAKEFSGSLLDVGCGGKPYKDLFKQVDNYIGLDIDQPRTRERAIADDYYDGTHFPYNDDSLDGILCSQVLEHVFEPDQFLEEVHRVLKDGGKLLLTVPFCWDEHEQPWDYARYTSYGLKYLLEKHDFKIVRQEKLLSGFPTLLQLMAGLIFKKIQRVYHYKIAKLILGPLLFFPINLLASISELSANTKKNDLYLDNLIIAIKE